MSNGKGTNILGSALAAEGVRVGDTRTRRAVERHQTPRSSSASCGSLASRSWWSMTVRPLDGPFVDAVRIAANDYSWLLALMALELSGGALLHRGTAEGVRTSGSSPSSAALSARLGR